MLSLFVLAACADVSGLNALEVDDAASDAEGDASGDVMPATSDGGLDATGDASFCTTQPQPWLWCADFDENDASLGYLNGTLTTWTASSGPLPSLAANYTSPPASAHFEGVNKSTLTFGHPPSNVAFEVAAQVQPVTVGAISSSIMLLIQLTPDYSLRLVAGPSGISSFTLSFDEAIPSDAGLQTTPHNLGSFAVGTWVFIDATINQNTIGIVAGGNKPVTFTHTAQPSQTISTTFGDDASGWAVNWDSIRVNF